MMSNQSNVLFFAANVSLTFFRKKFAYSAHFFSKTRQWRFRVVISRQPQHQILQSIASKLHKKSIRHNCGLERPKTGKQKLRYAIFKIFLLSFKLPPTMPMMISLWVPLFEYKRVCRKFVLDVYKKKEALLEFRRHCRRRV